MSESGRGGVCSRVGYASPPHSGPPRAEESVCFRIRGAVGGRGCLDWDSAGGWGSYLLSGVFVPAARWAYLHMSPLRHLFWTK
eukprot:58971-Pyramimonas_sp.AAC.1